MTRDTEAESRMLLGEAEVRSPPDHASVEPHREQTDAVRLDRRDGRAAVRLTRRGVLGRLAGAVGGLVLSGVGYACSAVADVPSYPVPADPTKVLGRGISPYGFRSQFETGVRWLFPTPVNERGGSMTPLHEARGMITPSSLHYELHHGGVPTIDLTNHMLLIHGLVRRPLRLTVYDLMRFPSVNRIAFLECSGNGFREWRQPTGKDVQQTHGLLSGTEWTGVPLSTLLWGFVEIRGLAWSGRGRIVRVEVSTDGGQNWGLAALQEPILPKALTVFRFPWQWEGQETILQSRCTDETGYIQPTRAALVSVRGLAVPFGSFYHYNAIQSWKVASDGSLHNVHA
jgi:Oxidoreductase molybdopterin binding domain/Mo-co oxidoreductase dimerisation domain